jgi:exosortase A-associated hydrolase 2
MQEDYFYLSLNDERVFAGHNRPDTLTSQAVVLCHPLGEEKLWSHRVFVSFARALAATGASVLRIDFRGEGDSDREFEESDFETRIADTNLAVDAVRRLNPAVTEVSLVGLRLGAAVAAAAATRRTDVSRLVLWDPVTDGFAYMQTVLRLNLMYQMALHRKVVESRDALVARLRQGETVNIEGYEMAEPLFHQVSDFQLHTVLAQFPGEVLALQINQDEAPMRPDLTVLSEMSPRFRIEMAKEQPFWREIKAFYQRAPELTRLSLRALGVGA